MIKQIRRCFAQHDNFAFFSNLLVFANYGDNRRCVVALAGGVTANTRKRIVWAREAGRTW